MINRVVLTGRLTRDPELRTTSNGTEVATFTLAVDRRFADKQGNRQADFINCVVWRKAAEALSNYTRKGSLIGVDGRIQTRSYDDKNGQKVFVTEVVVDDFSFLESRNNKQSQNQSSNSSTDSFDDMGITSDDLPF